MMPLDMTARLVEQEREPQRTPIPTRIIGQPIRTWTPPLGDLSSIRREKNNTLVDVDDPEQQDSWDLTRNTTITRTLMYDEVDDDTHSPTTNLSTLTEPAGGVEEQTLEELAGINTMTDTIKRNDKLPIEVNKYGGIMDNIMQGYFETEATEIEENDLANELRSAWQEESHEGTLPRMSLAEELRQEELKNEMREEVDAETVEMLTKREGSSAGITRVAGNIAEIKVHVEKRTKPRFVKHFQS